MNAKCPICGKEHELSVYTRKAKTIIKGIEVEYDEQYYLCSNKKNDNEFVTASMENSNLLNARNAYRIQMGLLTSDEIVEIREKYGLSQVDLSQILGWGEATISRYESKAIQDSAYDNILRLIKNNPVMLYYFYFKNNMAINENKKEIIKHKLEEELESKGRDSLVRSKLESYYLNYSTPSLENGYKELDIDKLEQVINYIAMNVDNLYKVKLMKFLWYIDVYCFQATGKSMTGLVYAHAKMGALPLGHDAILTLDEVICVEEETEDYDNTRFHIIFNDKLRLDMLTKADKKIIDKVVDKFKEKKTKSIVDYMHKEEAYIHTEDEEIISFEWAKYVK